MTARHQERAQKVVESFQAQLDQKVLDAIPATEFEQLALIVQQALSDELHEAADQVEELAKRLRSGTSMSDVGMGFM